MAEEKQEILFNDIKADAEQLKHGYIVYKLIVHQGQIVGYEEVERRKVRRL